MNDDHDEYLWDKKGEPDPTVARLEAALAPLGYRKRATERAARETRRPRWPAYVAVVAAAAVIFLFLWRRDRDHAPSVAVTRLAGAPRVASVAIGERGELGVGAWVETDEASRADIELAAIGHVEVTPNSRVRLVATGDREQRLELTRGAIEARVVAPPRIFLVDTPSAQAIDLGCAYRLEVIDDGGSRLRVTQGAVELAGAGRSAWVPATAACESHPGRGPGCPWFSDAREPFVSALRRVEYGDPDDGALASLLASARERDTLTLWHLGERLAGEPRARVFAKIRDLAHGTWTKEPALGDLVSHW
ncbi:MAG TPA: FecR family protein [Labilithrix sp.]|jgi:hypothetical protein